ncbi:MAG: hypothetical protein E7315_02105 [Clostridiales bacterium]|nr:hypothetical protein [Clostridiales bacterium]
MRRVLLPILLCMALSIFYVFTNGKIVANDLYYNNFVQREVINVSITEDYNSMSDESLSFTIGSDTDDRRLQMKSIVGFFSTAVPLSDAPSEDFSISSDCNYFFIFKFANNHPDAQFYYSNEYNCIVEKIVYNTGEAEIVDFRYYRVDENFHKFMSTYNTIAPGVIS